VTRAEAGWLINGKPLADGGVYKAAVNDFLVSGKEPGLEFFSDRNLGLRVTCPENGDIRILFRDYLQKRYGGR
jgi:hypothetical protein